MGTSFFSSRRLPIIAGIAIAVVMVAALTAVVFLGGGDEGDDKLATSDASTSTTVSGGPATDGAPAVEGSTETTGVDGGSTQAGGASETTVAASGGEPSATSTSAPSGELGAPEDPGPATPPQAGSYTYSATGTEGGTQDVKFNVEDKGEQDGERRQSVSFSGQEGSAVIEQSWRRDGLFTTKMNFSAGAQSSECDWEPDFKTMTRNFAPGTKWSYQSSCTATFQGRPFKLDRKGDFEVVELVRMKVGDQVVDVWRIQSSESTAFAAMGNSTEETTAFFSPRHGLPVKMTTKASGTGPNGSRETNRTLELKSLTPE